MPPLSNCQSHRAQPGPHDPVPWFFSDHTSPASGLLGEESLKARAGPLLSPQVLFSCLLSGSLPRFHSQEVAALWPEPRSLHSKLQLEPTTPVSIKLPWKPKGYSRCANASQMCLSQPATGTSFMQEFSVASGTNYHIFSGLRQHKILIFWFWRSEVWNGIDRL